MRKKVKLDPKMRIRPSSIDKLIRLFRVESEKNKFAKKLNRPLLSYEEGDTVEVTRFPDPKDGNVRIKYKGVELTIHVSDLESLN